MPLDPTYINFANTTPTIDAAGSYQKGLDIAQARQMNPIAIQQAQANVGQIQATTGQTQANTGLINQNTSNAALENQANQLKLAAAHMDVLQNYFNDTNDKNFAQKRQTAITLGLAKDGDIPSDWNNGGKEFTSNTQDTMSANKSKVDLQAAQADAALKRMQAGQIGILTGQVQPGQPYSPGNPQQAPQPNPGQPGAAPTQTPTQNPNGIPPVLAQAQSPTTEMPVGTEVSDYYKGQPLSSLGPVAIRAQKMLDGTEPVLNITSTRDPIGYAAANLARQINPGINDDAYTKRVKTLGDLAPSGELGSKYGNLNAWAAHSKDLQAAWDDLKNNGGSYGSVLGNEVGNYKNSLKNPSLLLNAETAARNVADEKTKFIVPGGGTLADREANLAPYKTNLPPADQKEVLKNDSNFIIDKLVALDQTKNAGLGKTPTSGNYITPETIQYLGSTADAKHVKILQQKYGYTPPQTQGGNAPQPSNGKLPALPAQEALAVLKARGRI